MSDREKIDMEIIALSEEVGRKVQTRHDMARARVVAERLRVELVKETSTALDEPPEAA
jgi:hypothetical protein